MANTICICFFVIGYGVMIEGWAKVQFNRSRQTADPLGFRPGLGLGLGLVKVRVSARVKFWLSIMFQ